MRRFFLGAFPKHCEKQTKFGMFPFQHKYRRGNAGNFGSVCLMVSREN